MFKSKKLGLKVAESKEEEFWEKIKINREQDIKSLKESLKYYEAIVDMAKQKLKSLGHKK